MSTGLRVFLVSPDQYIIYSLKDASTKNEYILNAGTLEILSGIEITAATGQLIAPPPEGASYLGFIFSRAATAAETEAALRAAHAQLSIQIQPVI